MAPLVQQSDQNKELAALRHSAAHLLAAAVLEIWPEAKPSIGPSIENGFYYDIDFGDVTVSEKDFKKIEKKMRQLVKNWEGFERIEVSKEEALEHYKKNQYKQELINEFAEEGKSLSIYKSGEFKDLCRGGHTNSPKEELKHFKLLSVAGAYWRGDENNSMLTRIYGTAFFSKEELDAYLKQQEEAKKRDHRKLGKELDLFTFSELVGPGLPLWTPRGALLRHLLDAKVWELRLDRGYDRVTIPHITKKDLYETSGHWDLYKEDLFRIHTREGHEFAMKPMNCPHHTQIFAHVPRSYRDMPQRYAETTMVYRDEQTGELNGLSRVRAITQDDAHVFCRENQVKEEAFKIWDIIEEFYKACGFSELKARMSFHDPENFDKYLGDKASWKKAEDQLISFAEERGAEYFIATGEAAFYGPKIDFMGYDSLGREWQLSTIQIDRNMPERFDLWCINEEGEKERIVMLHAAIMGSIERFMSILIEHTAGEFPFWLSPVQAVILPIADRHGAFADEVFAELKSAGLRVEVDDSSETLGKKIRNARKAKVPYMLVIGDNEVEAKKVTVRKRGVKEQEEVGLKDIAQRLTTD